MEAPVNGFCKTLRRIVTSSFWGWLAGIAVIGLMALSIVNDGRSHDGKGREPAASHARPGGAAETTPPPQPNRP